jgi:acyl-CoA synthetase (AMP-forming)/AMP-acid ligase II
MNISHLLHERARIAGDETAIVEPGNAITFDELDRAAGHVAQQFDRSGLRCGDHVVVICPMSISLYAVLIGLWRIGAVAVFVDPSSGVRRVEDCCRIVEPRAFIGTPRAHLLRLAVPSLRRARLCFSVGRRMPIARRLSVDPTEIRLKPDTTSDVSIIGPEAPALITFTSGSTGTPKAVVRTHGFLLAQHRAIVEALDLRCGQRDLATLPIFVLANLASGVTTIIPSLDLRRPGTVSPAALAEDVHRTHPTRLAASPAFVTRLVEADRLRPGTLGTFERIDIGGAPVPPLLLRQLAEGAPSTVVTAVYGSTEAEPIARVLATQVTDADRDAMEAGRGLVAGHPAQTIDLRIVPDRWGEPLGPYTNAEFDREALPPGQTGEIVVSGDHVVRGYLGGRGDDESKVRVGNRVWHRTGDAGYLDARGRLWLMGRCGAKADDARGVLYPFAVEIAAQIIAGVNRCALLAYEGRRLLLVEVSPGAPRETTRAIHSQLAWARLDEVRLVPKLPLDHRHNAKIDYAALRKPFLRPRSRSATVAKITKLLFQTCFVLFVCARRAIRGLRSSA